MEDRDGNLFSWEGITHFAFVIILIQLHAHREEQHMFEADFRITALVKSDGQGQRVFRVTEREAPANDAEFLSRLAEMYQQAVYASLQPGDDLTVAVRLDLPPREVERTVHLREDRLFEGEGVPQPTADPLPCDADFLRAIHAAGETRRCLHDHIPGAALLESGSNSCVNATTKSARMICSASAALPR
jgi:hypothetical protein